MNKLGGSTIFFVLLALGTACGVSDETEATDEEDLTEAPYLEVVKTTDPEGSKIVAHGLPAVSRTSNPAGSLVQAALLIEEPSSVAGYSSFRFEERTGMGSFTGSSIPLISVDARTSPPTVNVKQNFVDMVNAQLKEDRWSRFIENTATNNTVTTRYGWTINYDTTPRYPKLHVARNGSEVLTKGAGYWADNAFGPSGCKYVPELAAAAVSAQHKALLLRVHYTTSDAACAITDRYFTEALP